MSLLISTEDIQKAKERIGDNMFDLMMEELGITDYDEKNKKCCCPFHDEDTPSFIYSTKTHSAHCFGACGRNYDILDVWISKGYTYLEAVQKLFEIAEMPYSFGERGVKTERNYRYPKRDDCGNKDKVYQYLNKRGLSNKTIDYLDICQDEHGNCVFNYYDTNDVLCMVKYRPSHKIVKASGEIKNWCQKGADTMPLLFNINRINVTQPLLICSGELDCAAAIESGWLNATSIPLGDQNTHWCELLWDWLEQFESIIICADNDESGMKYCKDIVPRLGTWRTKTVVLPENIKDLNEALFRLGKEKTLDLIVNAKDTPVPSVEDFSNVKAIDFSEMDGVKTGINAIDRELIKLPYGTLTLLSGMPGAGKSSLISQIICNTVDEGKNVWLFSGELSNPISKSWLNFLLAGQRNIETFTSDGDSYYKVKNDAIDQINEAYRGQWYVYKDNCDNDIDSLISSATDSIRKYGIKLVILDNLMTVSNTDSDNELKEQTAVIKKLVALAQKYNVAVILVAHPRKLAKNVDMGLFDVAGSSNLVNLAHRTISLRRVTESEKAGEDPESQLKKSLRNYDVVCSVIKDRMRGRSGIQKGMYFDPMSRRFYTTYDEFDRHYAWDKKNYSDTLPCPKLEEQPDESEVFGD